MKILKLISLSTLHHWCFKFLFKGKEKQDYLHLVKQQVAKDLPRYQSTLMSPALKEALGRGQVFLLSSSPDFIVQEYANAFGFHGYLGTTYSIDQCGKFFQVDKLVDGQAKWAFAKERVKEGRVSYAYSDDLTDKPLLENVDYGYLVTKKAIEQL